MTERSARFSIVLLACALAVGLLSSAVYLNFRKAQEAAVAEVLGVVVAITQQALTAWVEEEKSEAEVWAESVPLRRTVVHLLAERSDPWAQYEAREDLLSLLRPVLRAKTMPGFLLLDPQGTVLTSHLAEEVALPLERFRRSDFLRRIVEGGVELSAPVVMPRHNPDDTGLHPPAFLLVGAPVRDGGERVLAALIFLVDPEAAFSGILERGRIGETGETYAFDERGRMMTVSRFQETLGRLDLLDRLTTDGRMIEIRDPGADLAAGEPMRGPRDTQPFTEMAAQALQGRSGVNTSGYRDYRGVEVVGAWVWDDALGLGIASELDSAEAFASLRLFSAIGAALAMLLVILMTVVITIALSASESRRARRVLLEQRRSLQDLLSNIDYGVVLFDRQRRLLAWNPAYEALLRLEPGQLHAGMSQRDVTGLAAARGLFGPGDPDAQVTARSERLWQPEGWRSDEEFFGERSYEVIGRRLANGALLITYTDVSERKAAARKIEDQRRALEQANRQKAQLFSVLSHDLRSPFNAILGYAQLVEQDVADIDNPRLKQHVRALQLGGERALSLAENLLHWSQSQLEKARYLPEAVSLGELAEQVLATLSLSADTKDIALSNEVDGASVQADPNMIMAVLRNLASNAVKFTPPGGRVRLWSRQEGRAVRIGISDSGIGIDAERQALLLDPERRTSSPGTEGEPGLGLGLMLCRDYLAFHGSRLEIESMAGAGSTFSFLLPLTASEAGPAGLETGAAAD